MEIWVYMGSMGLCCLMAAVKLKGDYGLDRCSDANLIKS